jgi:hypothetical protein
MNVSLIRGPTMLLVALTVGTTAARPASAFAAETDSATVHVRDGNTARRVALEETPMPDQEPGTVGAVTLAIVVYQGKREIGRFAIEGNQGELATDRSSHLRPVVFAITRSCGGSCSSLYVTAVEVPQNGNPKEILRQQFFGGNVTVRSNGFTVSEPEYEEGEPNCCPSREKVSTFKRRGAAYRLVRSRVRAKTN